MKLFLREHFLLITVQIIQCILIPILFWLDGYRNMELILYTILLFIILTSIYLIYKYVTRRRFYKRLEDPMDNLGQSLETIGNTPIAEALEQLLRSQYQLYQEELQEAKDRQDEHLLFMDRWVHQMKTPLSVIELTAQSLDEPESSSIREETDRMKNGLNTVLYMARLKTIAEDFHIKPIELAKLVNEVNQDHKFVFIRNEVYPKLEAKRENITVESDEKWLFFILSQLIQNAVKYSSGKSKQIIISLYERGAKAVLEVKDFGVGIPDVDIKRVFSKFYTGENGRKYRESTGMGLYLVKEVVDTLEHQIEIESAVDKGTTVRIIFSSTQNLTSM